MKKLIFSVLLSVMTASISHAQISDLLKSKPSIIDYLNANFNASSTSQSVFIGQNAGSQAENAYRSNFWGFYAGFNSRNAVYSNFLGYYTGANAINASYSIFLGSYAGRDAANATYSVLIGHRAGFEYNTGQHMGSNNIIIGSNISLPDGTTNTMNLGGVLFGTGLYSTITGNPGITPAANGRIGIDILAPSARLHLPAGSAAVGYAPLKLTAGTNLSATEAGAMEYDGAHLYFTLTNGGTRYQIDQQGSILKSSEIATALGYVPLSENQPITISGDASGNGKTSILITLANSGITAGTYNHVTVDAKGRVTAGSNESYLKNNNGNIEVPLTAKIGQLDCGGNATVVGNLVVSGDIQVTKNISTNGLTVSENVTANKFMVNGGTAAQFLKADGSFDNNSYLTGINTSIIATALGYTPYDAANPNRFITSTALSKCVPLIDGNAVANKFVANGGTAAQFLKADGSFDTNSYLTGINTGMIASALGYTPYDAANPNGYITPAALSKCVPLIEGNAVANKFVANGGTAAQFLKADGSFDTNSYLTGINTGMIATALGYTPYDAANPNGYITPEALSAYLPLKGGSVTGPLSIQGNLGIGTTSPDQKLTVKGKIHTEEVIVDLAVPADYVFAKGYSLMPLHKVEQYVKTNSHLPDVPSATEIKDKGLGIGEMQNKLLQKIEELTLYAIEQQKEIQALKEEVKQLKK